MKKPVIILLFLLRCGLISAQDPAYSQFYANPLSVNPAFAGTSLLSRIVFNYRNQWPRQGVTFKTYSLSFDRMMKKTNAGWGIQAVSDMELNNVVRSNQASFSYSYHLKLDEWSFITLGLQAGIVLKQFDSGNLIFPSQIDQLSGEISSADLLFLNSEKKIFPDFGFGTVFQRNEIYGGLSLNHLNQPDESLIEGDQKGKLPLKFTMHAGARLLKYHHGLLSRDFRLSPNFIYQHQGTFRQLNLGIYMVEKSFVFGGWYRNNLDIRPDAIIALAGIANKWFQFGYSFDFTLSRLSSYSYGTHEISLTFFFGKPAAKSQNKLLIPMI